MPGEELQRNMANDSKVRKADKQRRLEDEYHQKLEELNADTDRVLADGEAKISQARAAQLQRLRDLVTRKAIIEDGLLSHTAALIGAYDTMKREFGDVLEKKMAEYARGNEILEDIMETNDEEEDNEDKEEDRDRDGGKGAGAANKGKGKAPADPRLARTSDTGTRRASVHGGQHAGGDRATEDRKTIIGGVPGREQVKRAEAMAKQGRRA